MDLSNIAFDSLSKFGVKVKVKGEKISLIKGDLRKSFKLLIFSKVSNTALNNLLFMTDPLFVYIKSSLQGSQAELLQKMGVNFLDINGNCFINLETNYIYNFHKSRKSSQLTTGPSPLKSAGLKYAFHVLREETLLYATIENIIRCTGVSQGSAATLRRSFQNNYLDAMEELDREKLIGDFSISFNNLLKERLKLSEYFCENLPQLLNDNRVKISGQHSAVKYMHEGYIKPRYAHLYVKKKDLGKLILENNLLNDHQKPNLKIYDDFFDLPDKYAPGFLTYTDLCGSDDPRDRDLAVEIANELV